MSTTSLITIIGAAGAAGGAGASLLVLGSTSYTESVNVKTGSQNRDSSGNFLMATTSSQPTIYDYQGVGSLSVAPDGTVNWQRNFDGTGSNDECYVQVPDGSGNVYNFNYGFYYSSSPNSNQIWCMKINESTGVASGWWKLSYTSWYTGQLVAAHYVSSTVIYVVINDYVSHGSSGGNVMFGTFNPSSNTLTNVRYWGGSNNNGTRCTAAICDGTYWYVRMTSAEVQGGTQDAGCIGKFTVAGVNQWWRTYGTSSQNNYGCQGIDIDSSGNVYSSYRYRNTGGGYWAGVVQKHNSSGTLQWEKQTNANSDVNGIYVDGDGRLFVSGNYNTGTNRFYASELNPSNGAEIWTNRLVPGSSPTGTWSTSSNTGITGGGISEDDDGNLVLMPSCNNSNFWYSSAKGFLTGIDKDGTEVELGTQLKWETDASSPWASITSTTFSTSALTNGSTTGSVTYYSSLPTNMNTSTTEFGTVVVPT